MSLNIKKNDCEFINNNPPITFPYKLDVFQKNAVNSIEEGHNVLVTAHTSAGKTTVAEYAIAKAIELNKKVIYTSPIKTLSNQKYYDFSKSYESVGILTGDIKQNPDADILIMTTEILRNMLFKSNELIDELFCVIFDEIHYINDRDRGHVWEETIIMLPNTIQIVMLSATINNPEKFGEWVALKGKNVDLVSTYYRPVPLKHNIFYKNELIQIMGNDKNFIRKNYTDIYLYYKKLYMDYVKPNRLINNLITYLKDKELFPCIFFCYSRKKCEKYANMINLNLIDHNEVSQIETILNKYLKGIFLNYEKLDQTQQLRKLLVKGIGVHHSGLAHPLKEIQEILFSKGLIKILFATETFAVGVNMPTRTVIFTELTKFDGYINGFRNLTTAEYLQMAGRAGRRGKDVEGTVIYLPLKEPVTLHEIDNIFIGNSININSKLKLNTNFLMKIIQSKEIQINNFIDNSLLGNENKDNIKLLMDEYNQLKTNVESQKLFIDNLKFKNEVNKIIKIEQEILNARNNKKRKLTNKLNNLMNDKVNKDLQLYKKYINDNDYLNKLQNQISNNTLFLELNISRDFLTELNYILKSEKQLSDLSRQDLTKKGIIASEINECNEILLSEIINEGYFNDLDVYEIFGILGIFIEDTNKEIYVSDLKISNNMKNVLNDIGNLNYELDKKAIDNNINYECILSLSFVIPAYMWAKGDSLKDIYQLNELELYEGNFIKNIVKILNICNEIINVCEIVGETILREKLENIESVILRDVVSFDSIYLLN